MTADVEGAVPITRSGVVVALPLRAGDAALAELVRLRRAPDGRFAPGERATIAVLGFTAAGSEAVVALERLDAGAVPDRAAFDAVLGFPIRDALRVESFIPEGTTDAALLAERALVAIAGDLARAFGGAVRDDVGAFYDLAELDALVAAGATRYSSPGYAEAAARLSLALPAIEPSPAPDGASRAPESSARESPAPASAQRRLFVCMTPFASVASLARMAEAVAAADDDATAARRPIAFAPILDARHATVLAAAGVAVARTPDALAALFEAGGDTAAAVSIDRGADGLELFTRDSGATVARLRSALERRSLELAESLGRESGTPSFVEMTVLNESSGVVRSARFAYPTATVDVRSVDLALAGALVRDAVAARTDVALLLGGAPACCVSLSYETAADATDAAVALADAFGTALVAELCLERDIATDAFGALFTRGELVELAIGRRGHADTRSETLARVAAAEA